LTPVSVIDSAPSLAWPLVAIGVAVAVKVGGGPAVTATVTVYRPTRWPAPRSC